MLAAIIALSLAGCAPHPAAAPGAAGARYAVLRTDDQPLREDFNRDRGNVRLVFLVDPICPECLRGLADMGDDLLSKLSASAPVRVYVVFEPVIGGQAKDIPAAAALLRSATSRLYWNPTGDFGRQMSHVLHYWNGHRWVYGWDTWLIYPPDAAWNGVAPPEPAFLMHQLGGLPHTAQFPHLDARVFTAKVHTMVASLGRRAVSQ
jgi:hypothetical protein